MENIDNSPRGNTKGEIVGQQNRSKHVTERKEYISSLPEAIMLHIFSLLPLKVLILASLVSKQWESLVIKFVKLIPSSLNFDELEMASRVIRANAHIIQTHRMEWPCIYQLCLRYSIGAANRNFAGFVNRTLRLHAGCIIKKLCFSFCYDGQRSSQERIDRWFHFAMTNQVRELELNFSEGRLIGHEKLTRLYELPHGQFSPMSLESIILKFCKLGQSTLGDFSSLKSLFFKNVKVLDFSVEELLSKCPNLEDLNLDCCTIPWNFMVSYADIMIKRLSIMSCRTEGWPMCHIDISAPELLMLTLEESYLMKPKKIKASKLTDFILDINQLHADDVQREALVAILLGLNHCQTLTLNTWCIQVLSYGAHFLQQSSISFNNLKHLKLQVGLEKEEFPGIAYMMRNCPYLEYITLDMHEPTIVHWVDLEEDIPIYFNDEEDNYWQSQISPFHCLQNCLKEVTIFGVSGRSSEIQMLQFFLENAKVLNNMSLCIPQEMLGHDILQKLSAYRKASPRATISICQHGFTTIIDP